MHKRPDLTRLDVLQEDTDVVVPVRAGLLVVEAQGVEQLMLHSVVVDATLTAQRHRLGITSTTHVGVTPVTTQRERICFPECPAELCKHILKLCIMQEN